MPKFLIIPLILSINIVFAIPRYAVENGASCNLCHVNPTGGGLRNDYGNTLFALDELPMRTSESLEKEPWDGFVNEYFQMGGDLRVQSYVTENIDDGEYRFPIFPMQADIYGYFTPSDNLSLFTRINLSGTMPNEFWLLIADFPADGWLKVGRSVPDFGLKLDDHTAYIRGGSIRATHGLVKEGLFFTPDKMPSLLEFGFKPANGLRLTAGVSNRFISSGDQSYGFNDQLTDKTFTAKASYIKSYFEIVHTNLMISYLTESVVDAYALSGGLSAGPLSWTFELSQADNWITETESSLALYHELAYTLKQGIDLIGKYEFFDPDQDISNGSVQRFTAGIEIFPRYGLQYIIQTRLIQLENLNADDPSAEFLFQLHYWF
jgi:hypothetical protein